MDTRQRARARRGPVRSRLGAALLPAIVAILAVAGGVRAEAGSTEAQVSFTHGVLAFEDGEIEKAAELFEAAVRETPDEGTFLHWLGLAYLRLGRTADAMARLEESLRVERRPAAGRARVKRDLRLARQALAGGAAKVEAPAYRPEALRFGELPLWEGRVALGTGWDSNPELVTEDRPFPLPGETVPGDVPSDTAAYLDTGVAFRPVRDRGGWTLGLDLAGHRSMYQDLDGLDLSLAAGTASLSWGGDPRGFLEGPLGGGLQRVPAGEGRAAVLLQAGGSRVWLGGDPYLTTAEAAASLFVRETPATMTRLGASYSERDFADEGMALLRPSGEELSGSVDQWIFLGRPERWLRFGVAAGRYDSSRFFERSFREASAEAAMPLANWMLVLFAGMRDDDFAEPESNLGRPGSPSAPPRQDTTWRASAAAVRRATNRLSWSLRGGRAWRDSNVEVPFLGASLLDYEKTVFSLGVEWHF